MLVGHLIYVAKNAKHARCRRLLGRLGIGRGRIGDGRH